METWQNESETTPFGTLKVFTTFDGMNRVTVKNFPGDRPGRWLVTVVRSRYVASTNIDNTPSEDLAKKIALLFARSPGVREGREINAFAVTVHWDDFEGDRSLGYFEGFRAKIARDGSVWYWSVGNGTVSGEDRGSSDNLNEAKIAATRAISNLW